MRFISTKGSAPSVDFETAILDGYAPDGGLYVPTEIQKSQENNSLNGRTLIMYHSHLK